MPTQRRLLETWAPVRSLAWGRLEGGMGCWCEGGYLEVILGDQAPGLDIGLGRNGRGLGICFGGASGICPGDPPPGWWLGLGEGKTKL